MNEKFNKYEKVEQLTKMFLSREEEKGLIVKDPFQFWEFINCYFCYFRFEKRKQIALYAILIAGHFFPNLRNP